MKVDQETLANIMGVSARTIRNWQSQGMPAEGDRNERKYVTEDCITWACVAGKLGTPAPGEVSENSDEPPPEDISDRRWKAARAEKKHLELRKRREELIPYEDARELVLEAAERIRQRLLNLPGRRLKEIAAETELATIQEIRMQAVREILEELQRLFNASARDQTPEA